MESVYNFSEVELLAFALVFFRFIGFIVSMPIIGTSSVPVQVKVLFALGISFIVFPVIGWDKQGVEIGNATAALLAIKELFVGIVFGYFIRLFFMALSMAGQIISVSLGVASAQLFNPAFGDSGSTFDQFFMILGTLIFLSINGHHLFFSGLVETFKLIPIQDLSLNLAAFKSVPDMFQVATDVGLKFSAPIFVTVLFTNVAMGLIGRAVPQINILITSLPVNTLVGLAVLFLSLPLIVWQMEELIHSTADMVFSVMKEL